MGWWSDRWNDVTSVASSATRAVTSTVSSAASAVVNVVEETVDVAVETVSELASDAVDAVAETVDNITTEVSTMASEAYETSMVWVADNVFAEDTWVGKGMNWAADAGDKLSNMYDYMIENPDRAFATIGEGLEEGIGYIVGTPGYIVDLVAEGGEWAYSSMTGAERDDKFGFDLGESIAGGVDTGFDHAQAGLLYAYGNTIGDGVSYADALDVAEVKVLNEEEALLKGITIGALEVGLLAATGGASGAARASAWTARLAGKADDAARLMSGGSRLSNTASKVGSAISTGAETVARPFRAAASIPGVSPALKYAVVPGALFYLNINNELSAFRVQELQERQVEMTQTMVNESITGFQEKEDYIQNLLNSQTDEINQMVEELNTTEISAERRAEIVTRFEELEAQADLIEEWQSPDTTEARRDEILQNLQERNQTVDAEVSNDVDGISTERPSGAGELGAQEFNPNADGSEPQLQNDSPDNNILDNTPPVEVKVP